MNPDARCPKCGSIDLMFSKKKQMFICEDCSYEFKAEVRPSRRLYISYGKDEFSALALQIKKDVELNGYQAWYNLDHIKNDTDHEKYIDLGFNWVMEKPDDGRFIVLLTPSSVRRPDGSCLSEIAKAVQKKMKIIPIMVSWCEPPLSICRIQWLDMMDCFPLEKEHGKYIEKLKLLIDAIEDEGFDYKGSQSRLLKLLEPLPFDVDIQKHLERFTGRQWIFNKVDKWLADKDGSRIFWIVGAPGVGKTAIASWLAFNKKEVAAFHLCSYGNAQRSDPRRAVLSIAYQLSTQLPDYQSRLNHINLEKIMHESNVKALFDSLIVQPLSGNFPEPQNVVVILIDALDEATKDGKNELSELIASEFNKAPKWLRLIITSRPDQEVMHPLQGLTPYMLDTSAPENEQDIKDYLSKELKPFTTKKEVPAEAIDKITAMSEGIFLYVEWIRKELSLNRLSLERLNEFPKGLTGVYSQFFTRQYPAIDRYRSGISPVLETIVAAVEPLKISLISSIFNWDEYGQADFYQDIGALFPITDGKVQPFHKSVIDWLTDKQKALDYFIDVTFGHMKLSNYGWNEYLKGVSSMSDYMLANLPAHLIRLEKWNDSRIMLTDLSYFEKAWKLNEFNVRSYWSRIEEKSNLKITDCYRHIIDEPEKYNGKSAGVANLLFETGHYDEALQLYNYLTDYFKDIEDHHSLKNSLGKKGTILGYRGETSDAIIIHKEEEEICRKLNDSFGLQNCLANQFNILFAMGDWDGISKLMEKMDSFCDQNSKMEMAKLLHVKAFLAHQKGDLDGSLKLFKEKEKLNRELKDFNGMYSAINNQACIYYQKGDFDHSLKLNKELEVMFREQGNKYALRYSLVNQSDIYHETGEREQAIKLLREAIDIGRELGHKKAIHGCLGNLSIIYHDAGEIEEALRLHGEEIEICNEINDKTGLQIALGNMALIYYDMGLLDEAMKLFKEKERLSLETSSAACMQSAIGNEALIMFDKNELDEAMSLHKKEEATCREMNSKKELYICLSNQADILFEKGDLDKAMELCRESEQAFRDLKYIFGLQGCLNTEAAILRVTGKHDEALKLIEEAESICRKTEYKNGLQACLGNKAILLYEKGKIEDALRLLGEAEKICLDTRNKEGHVLSMIDRAIIFTYNLSNPDEGLKMAKEAYIIAKRSGIVRLEKKIKPILDIIEDEASIKYYNIK
jgi:tetratricopeptide (TPR) repeat protein